MANGFNVRCCSANLRRVSCLVLSTLAGSAVPALAQFTDGCASAPTVNEGVFGFDLSSATSEPFHYEPSCADGRQPFIDQWIRYVPTTTGPVAISTIGLTTGDTVLSVHDTSDPAFDCDFYPFYVLGCSDNAGGPQSRVIVLAEAGHPMLIRIAGADQSRPFGSVSIESVAPAPGDTCETAVPAVDGINSYDTSTAVINSFSGCFGFRDVFYTYTPTQSGALTISACNQPTEASIAVLDWCGGNLLACSDYGFCTAAFAAEAGVPIIIRMSNDASSGPEQFTISLDPNGIAPNDECTAPELATLGDTTFNNTFSTTSRPIACNFGDPFFSPGLDVWYTFTPPATGSYDLSTEASIGISATRLAIYTDCEAFPIACDEPGRGFLSFIRTPLVAGQPYFIQISGTGAPSASAPYSRGEGTLSIRQSIPPNNDECDTATPTVVGLNPYDLYDATTGFQYPSCLATGWITRNDVWFRHVPAANGPVEFSLSPDGAAYSLSIFEPCDQQFAAETAGIYYDPAAFTFQPRMVVNGLAGSPIFVRVATRQYTDTVTPRQGTGDLFVGAPTTSLPINDKCSNALTITEGTTVAIDLTGSIKDCTTDDRAAFDSCAAPTDNDIFYRFTPVATGRATITIEDGVDYPFYDGLVASIYDMCGSAPLACSLAFGDAPLGTLRFDVVAGNEYIIRVASVLYYGSLGIQTGSITLDPTIDCSCVGDADCDADTDSDDILTFFAAWDNGESGGDVDDDQDTDSDDIITFFASWETGC